MKIKSVDYFSLIKVLFQGLGISLLFSLFIYTEYFDLTSKAINSLMALVAFYLLLTVSRRFLIITGAFVGLLWFYWIGYSFEYYHVGWMAPFITLFFILLYALFFGVAGITTNPFYRAGIFFVLSYVEPMDWNWLQMELPFVNSYMGIEKWQYALILFSLALFVYLSKIERYRLYRFGALLLLLGSLDYDTSRLSEPDLKIKLYAPMLLQEEKWVKGNRRQIIEENFRAINSAIQKRYDLIVLPESAFPLFLNKNPFLIMQLKKHSQRIDIITGALLVKDGLHYNVSYHFSKGEMTIAKKMVLVPFGEYVPLPKFLREWVNTTFFDGSSDFVTADAPTDFMVKGIKFRNAICYEATCDEIYQGDPDYLIAISNNGWFYPSIEPTLQRLLMQYYAKRYHTIIYHSANMGGTGIVRGDS